MAITRSSRGSTSTRNRSPRSELDPLLPSTIKAKHATDGTSRSYQVRTILFRLGIALAIVQIGGIIFLAVLANSFRPSSDEISTLTKTAFKYDPTPLSASILNVTDDGILVNATIRCGVDLDKALGLRHFKSEEEKEKAWWRGERGTGPDWWEKLRRWAAKDKVPSQVMVNVPDTIHIIDGKTSLFTVHITKPLRVPMIPGVRHKNDWMKPMNVLIMAKPVASTGELMEFGQKGWAAGSVKVGVKVQRAVVHLPLKGWLARFSKVEKKDLFVDVKAPIPHLPGLPKPGDSIDFSKLVELEGYHLSNEGDALDIRAGASMPNFANTTNLNTTIPYGLPFSVYTGGELMAEVITEPVVLNSAAKDIKLRMSGRLVSNSSKDSPLGPFIHNFLTGVDNNITVRGMSVYPSFQPNTTIKPPRWALSSLNSININLTIPGPQPPPKIINSMSLEHMRISRAGGVNRASGTVIVEIDLPGDIGGIEVDVTKVLPEVYMFDGPVVPGDGTEKYPPGAFGHLKPAEYLHSTTYKGLDPAFPNRLTVRAPLEDVPIDLLPGRSRLLADFVRKVVFKGGAMAGVNGSASAVMRMKGIDGKVVLDGLPIEGETWVGRQG